MLDFESPMMSTSLRTIAMPNTFITPLVPH
jgi:hypothetical protein